MTSSEEKYYLKIGRASELESPKERAIYKFLEILPGFLAWSTLFLLVFLSWQKPIWVAFFIISFDIYWIFKTIYLAFHLRAAYKRMKISMATDWRAKLDKLRIMNPAEGEARQGRHELRIKGWHDIYHLIILPMYREPVEVVRPSFEALINTDYPKNKMIVVLATEERGGEDAQKTAGIIEKEFGNKFFKFLITRHPSNIEGELAGKGSNETWAARRAKEDIIDPLKVPYENIITSSLDVDSVVYPKYFSCLTYKYLRALKPTRTSFQPIPLFINNIWEAPALARIIAFSSTFWHMMNQERPEKHTTFSSHSMSFKALVDIDFWQTNVVSEDSRIFWQCFLYYDGDYRVESLYYPLSMDANVAKSFWRTLINLYKQQRRWAYGAADMAYFTFGFFKNLPRHFAKNERGKIPLRKMLRYGFSTAEGFYSWATNALIILVFGWLPLFLGGEEFNATLLSYNLPRVTRVLLTLAMVGIISSAYTAIILLPPRPPNYGKWKYVLHVLEWVLIPINMIVLGAFPALEAQTRLMLGKYMGFWFTPKMRKKHDANIPINTNDTNNTNKPR